MTRYSLSHLSDHTLLRELAALVARDRVTTAELLAHIAEVDARKLYLPAAYPSMFTYCVGELRLSEDSACKRIRAARAARQFPAIFDALAQGRLHLSAVVLLAPHLTEDTARELLAAAEHQSKSEVEQLLAQRFPQPALPARLEAVGASPSSTPERLAATPGQPSAPGRMGVDAAAPRAKVTPLAPQSFAVQFTMNQSTHDKLRYAQALLSHQIPSGDLAAVVERALDALIPQLEKRKFAATVRPRPGHRRSTASPRYIPAHVKRTVWERDQGQCTFVSESGRRCPARTRLEFDHSVELARGGETTVAGIRLRCRAHNQYQAERTFGVEFMRHKRRAAAAARAEAQMRAAEARAGQARAEARVREPAAAAGRPQAEAAKQAKDRDVVPWLRQLGFSAGEARRAAALCEDIPDASLEERMRVALSLFRGKSTRVGRAVDGPETATRGHDAGVPAAC